MTLHEDEVRYIKARKGGPKGSRTKQTSQLGILGRDQIETQIQRSRFTWGIERDAATGLRVVDTVLYFDDEEIQND